MLPFSSVRNKFGRELLYRELSARSGRPLSSPRRRGWGVKLGRVSHSVPSHLHCLCLFSPRLRGCQVLSAFSGSGQSESPRMKTDLKGFRLLRTCLLTSKVLKERFHHWRVLKSTKLTGGPLKSKNHGYIQSFTCIGGVFSWRGVSKDADVDHLTRGCCGKSNGSTLERFPAMLGYDRLWPLFFFSHMNSLSVVVPKWIKNR